MMDNEQATLPQHVPPLQDPENANVLMTLFDTTQLLETIENTLRGLRWNRLTGKWEYRIIGYETNENGVAIVDDEGNPVPRVAQPLVNEIGVSRIMTFLESHTHHIFQASKFESKEVRDMALESSLWIVDQCFINRTAWGLEVTDMETVCEIVDHAVFAILKQAWAGGMRELLQSTHNIHEVISQQRASNEGGASSRLKGLFSRN